MTKSQLASHLRGTGKRKTAPHIIVKALAGSGKTTTLVEGLRYMRGEQPTITPSPQQEAIWKAMALSQDVRSVCFVAFNNSVAKELGYRVPQGCQARTNHSLGRGAVIKAFGKVEMTKFRVPDIIADMEGKNFRDIDKVYLNAVKNLVSKCKMEFVDGTPEDLDYLCGHYDIDLGSYTEKVYETVPLVLERCKDVNRDKRIDFDDMIWLPVVLDLPLFKYDVLLVDESQDLNRCQQELILRSGKRIILCGDSNQAIYGFAGADVTSMSRMYDTLSSHNNGCVELPLTMTRRCGRAIVEEACKIVPEFEAHESNPPGTVRNLVGGNKFLNEVEDGDMVLCRTNAPLVSMCFRLLRSNRKAQIMGRNIAEGLISTINRMKASSVEELVSKLEDWYDKEVEKENRKKHPNDERLIALEDRYLCLQVFCERADTVQDVIDTINKIFSDETTDGVLLSSVHKAKGLEADRVYILMPNGAGMPHPMAKSDWQREQEMNLKYVAITRAIHELTWVVTKKER